MGGKSSKHNAASVEPLARDTIDELCQDTGFSEEELIGWHTNFYKDCPDGKLTLRQFEQQYAKIMGKPTPKTANYIKHMFNVYDQDKNQYIDFKEFVMALSAASVVNRVRLVETLFHVFDLDSDGKITKEEIGKMLHTLVDVTDSNDKRRKGNGHRNAHQTDPNKQVNIQRRIDDAFNELNANDDDYITKEEFIEWYMKSGLISEVQTNEVDIQETSRLQQKEKKSRKSKKPLTNLRSNQEQDENRTQLPYLVRHMSRMTERKSPLPDLDEEDDDDGRIETMNSHAQPRGSDPRRQNDPMDAKRRAANPLIRITTSSDNGDLPHSKENERWQHLFHSVLGQIRTQNSNEQVSEATTQPRHSNGFNNKKRNNGDDVDDDSLEMKRMPQSSNAHHARPNPSTRDDRSSLSLPPPRTITAVYDDDDDDDDPPSPDVYSIRL